MAAGSRALLDSLNGGKRGRFAKWLASHPGESRLAWYPSAGEDFRWLLYLHKDYRKVHPASEAEPPPPDIFIHTDYYPWDCSTFLDSPHLYSDQHTSITVVHIEELPRLNLPVYDDLVDGRPVCELATWEMEWDKPSGLWLVDGWGPEDRYFMVDFTKERIPWKKVRGLLYETDEECAEAIATDLGFLNKFIDAVSDTELEDDAIYSVIADPLLRKAAAPRKKRR